MANARNVFIMNVDSKDCSHSFILSVCKDERETHIVFTDADLSATIYSCSLSIINRLESLCLDFPDIYQKISSDKYGCKYICPKTNIGFKKPRLLSKEQRQKKAAILSKTRQERSNK
jgi:hypothetical protein